MEKDTPVVQPEIVSPPIKVESKVELPQKAPSPKQAETKIEEPQVPSPAPDKNPAPVAEIEQPVEPLKPIIQQIIEQ